MTSMLKKIVTIEGVGRYLKYHAVGDVQFRKSTLVYAPNGRGKTTLCDILRSLKTGDPAPVLGRATLGEPSPPRVEILLNDSLAKFEEGSWSRTVPQFEIYDSRFVHANVYAGECVEHSQRRSLHGVIIGEQGVELRGEVDRLDDAFRKAGKAQKEAEDAVLALIPNESMSVEEFVALEQDAEIDAKIADMEARVAALRAASQLQAKPLLSALTVPTLPESLEDVLRATLDDVSAEAEAAVTAHMADHMAAEDEEWIVRGLELARGDECPFCEQSLSGIALVTAYRDYFSTAYRDLQSKIEAMTQDFEHLAEAESVLSLQRTLAANQDAVTSWAPYVTLETTPAIDIDAVTSPMRESWRQAQALLKKKAAHPLESVALSDEHVQALREVESARAAVATYNAAVEVTNATLRSRQEEAEQGDLAKTERELIELLAIKVRHKSMAKKVCADLLAKQVSRNELDIEKQRAKADLEQYSRDVFQRYQRRINKLLEEFGATFRIAKAGERYRGGKPSSTYCLVIDDQEVPLGDQKTPLSTPSFKNTLSAGDKSALALAFFLARLAADTSLATKIVVLDDPFTSQDASRQTCTQQEIRRLSQSAGQVVVLSHDKRFLKRVWDGLDRAEVKTLQLSPLGDTVVTEWDIESVQDEYVQTYTRLWQFCHRNEGDPELAVKTIRPLLEGYLRMKLPREFSEKQWLGDYVRQIREAPEGSVVGQAKRILPELEDLKDYAKRHHHPSGSDAPDEPVEPAEVLAYGRRALTLVEAF